MVLDNSLRLRYEFDRKTVPTWMLDNPPYSHLQSYEVYVLWYKRNMEMFSPIDRARNIV